MTDRFVEVILKAIEPLKGRNDLRVETDDLSTLVIGAPEPLFAVVEDCFVKAARETDHVVLSAIFSRGCPGEPDDPICHPMPPERAAVDPVVDTATVEPCGIRVAAQFALYPLGIVEYMPIIYREIQATKEAKVFNRGKHFCTRLDGNAHQVFAVMRAAFDRAARDAGHVVITATVSKGSPTTV